jgi:SNF2 family DNA or RNA helicase
VIPDVRLWAPEDRFAAGEASRIARDVSPWPALSCWNDRVCLAHRNASGPCLLCGEQRIPHLCPLCDQCGVRLRSYQRTAAAWLFYAGRGLLADTVGLGKTAAVAAMLALCRESGELSTANRAVLLCKPAAIGQWARELARMIPSLRVITAPGSMTRAQRIAAYCGYWEVAVLSDRTLSPSGGDKRRREGDIRYLQQFTLGTVIYDDIDAMRKRTNRGAKAVRDLAAAAPRVIGVHGTPVQKKLIELYNFLEPLGGPAVLGTERQFRYRYIRTTPTAYVTRDNCGQVVEKERVTDTGIMNEHELRPLIAPLVLRRRAQDVDDVSMPALQLNTVWLDPSPEQKRRYEELRAGVLRKIREDGEITRMVAESYWMYGWQICSGLATLDGGRDDSVKLDWVMDRMTGDLDGEKAVVFVNFKPNVEALRLRMEAAGIGGVVMWGNEADQRERDRRLDRFRHDPGCRALIGTTTIEQSLNLQVARHMIAVDSLSNPARMTQLAGRVRRTGSPFPTVFFHQLLLRGTQEEDTLFRLHSEQATADAVWNEQGELFHQRSALEIMQVIAARRAA